jgi:hypothetical protein
MDEDELKEHKARVLEGHLEIADMIAAAFGIPAKNVRRDLEGIINGVKTIVEDVQGRDTTAGSLKDEVLEEVQDTLPVWGWLSGRSKTDKLYGAIVSGDKVYEQRLRADYDDKEYKAALRKALRDNDPRIKEAARAAVDIKTAEYMRILGEIVSEGNFDRAIVTAAIAAEIDKLKESKKK